MQYQAMWYNFLAVSNQTVQSGLFLMISRGIQEKILI